jgi:hypothetical protein
MYHPFGVLSSVRKVTPDSIENGVRDREKLDSRGKRECE